MAAKTDPIKAVTNMSKNNLTDILKVLASRLNLRPISSSDGENRKKKKKVRPLPLVENQNHNEYGVLAEEMTTYVKKLTEDTVRKILNNDEYEY